MSLTREALLVEALKEGGSLAQALDAARAAWQWLQGDMPAPPPAVTSLDSATPPSPRQNPSSPARWTREELDELQDMALKGVQIEQIARHFGRNVKAVSNALYRIKRKSLPVAPVPNPVSPVVPVAPVPNPVSSAREAELAAIEAHIAAHGVTPWAASVEAKTGGLTPGQIAAQRRMAGKK